MSKYTCLAVTLSDFVLCILKKCFFFKLNTLRKGKKMIRYITVGLEISFGDSFIEWIKAKYQNSVFFWSTNFDNNFSDGGLYVSLYWNKSCCPFSKKKCMPKVMFHYKF